MPLFVPVEFCAPFRKSANRRHLFGGAEPKVFMSCIYVSGFIGISIPNRYGLMCAIGLFLFLRSLARYMAKKDPYMSEVYRSSLKFGRRLLRLTQHPVKVFVLCSSKKKSKKLAA